MGGTVRVLTIRGIPINVHVSWLVIYGLITWTLAVGYFPRALPDLPAAAYWANGLLAAFLLFVSVLLHELSHSFAGCPLEMEGQPRFRDYIASRVGAGFALALMALGVLQVLGGDVIGGFWFIVIGMFLRGAADASYSQMALREALARLPVRDIMAREVVTVPLEASVAQLADAFWSHHVTSFPVVDGDTVRGIASVQQVRAVPAERRMERRVREVMRPLTDDLIVGPDESVFDALGKASRNQVGRLAVLKDSRLVGYLSLKDITHLLALRGLPDGVRSAPDAGTVTSAPGRRAA